MLQTNLLLNSISHKTLSQHSRTILKMSFDYFSGFKIPLILLKTLGIWQQRTSSRCYRLYGILLHLVFVEFFLFSHTVHAIGMFMNGSIKHLSAALTILFTWFSMTFKSYWIMTKITKLEEMMVNLKLLLEMSSFGTDGARPKLKAKIIRVTQISKMFYVSAFFVCSMAVVQSIICYKERNLLNETWFFVDHKQDAWIYWTLEIYQCLMSFYGVCLGVSFDIIPVIFMRFGSALLDEVSMEISSKSKCEREEEMLKNLEKCMECHIKTKSFIEDISKHLSFFFLLQALLSTVVLCTSAFLLTIVIVIVDFCGIIY